jgi:hypothetical protein
MRGAPSRVRKEHESLDLPIWQELLVPIELAYLQISPIYWGYGVPPGDGSAVVVVPGFLGTDSYLNQLRAWLERIGYRSYYSNIGLNAECPNLLIRQRLSETVLKACTATGRKIHLIGHSLGGMLARAIASQTPRMIASVITLGTPIRGVVAHPSILRAAERVRLQILQRHGPGVLPGCYTGACTCDFLESLMGDFPECVRQTAIYTRSDGIVDWRVCRTGVPGVDIEVSATHLGMVFSPLVYGHIGRRLAGVECLEVKGCRHGYRAVPADAGDISADLRNHRCPRRRG